MMNLRQATRSVLTLMVVFFFALVAVFFWTVDVLTQPYDVMQQFRLVREKVLVTTAKNLDDYYHTSNSLSLKSAQDTVAHVIQDAAQLPPHVQTQLQSPLTILQRSLNEEISAGGEMAANPDALLEQNEREMSGWLKALEQYADAASPQRSNDAVLYRRVALLMREALQRLSVNREQAFRVPYNQENVFVTDLRQLEMNFAVLKSLPLLGVMEQNDDEEDELALGLNRKQKTQVRDRGLMLQEEIGSLIARYPREWGFALRDLRMAARAQAALKAELQSVSDAIERADRNLNEWRQHDTEKATQLFLGLMMVFILVLAIAGWNMKRRVISPLLRTSHAIREIDDAHGWRLDVPDQSVSELHELAENVNEFIVQVRNEKAMERKVA